MNKATAYGYGSVYQRQRDKRWVAAVMIPTPAGEKRKRKTFIGHSREEVQARLDAFRADYETAPPVAGGRRAYLARAWEQGPRHTEREWFTLLRERKSVCEYCGVKTLAAASVRLFRKDSGRTTVKDHRVPLVRGGSDGIDNVAVCCQRCNAEKAIMTADEYRAWKAGR